MHGDDPHPAARDVFCRLQSLLAFVLDTDGAAIRPETKLVNLPDWSSLTFAVMLVGIRKRFGITLEPERALGARTAGGLARLIQDSLARSGHG